MQFRIFTIVVLAIALSACGKPNATCSDDASKAALEQAVRNGLEKVIVARSKDGDGKQVVGFSVIRAAIANLKLVFENIRTTKEDPNSTKKFCTGNLKIVFGTQVFADADKAREIAGLTSLTDATDTAGMEKGVDYLKGDLDYSVQPTDDGAKIVAEFASADAKLDVFGEVVAASLLRSGLETTQRLDKENAQLAEKQQQDAMNASNRARIEEAAIGRRSADEALSAVWRGLEPATRQQLLPEQRAWIKRKDATCKVQGLESSTDPTEQQLTTINCVASETRTRTNELQNYFGSSEGE